MKVSKLMFTVKETAEILTRALGKLVNIQRVYYLIRMGRLTAIKFGRHAFSKSSIRVYLDFSRLFPASSLSSPSTMCA